MIKDIPWQQRLQNFENALGQLSKGVALASQRSLTDLEKQGLIQVFEFTHELAWNTLKDYLEFQGISGLIGSRDVSREGFQRGLIEDGDSWMEMIKSRNQTTHTYNKAVAQDIVDKVLKQYFPLFSKLEKKMQGLK